MDELICCPHCNREVPVWHISYQGKVISACPNCEKILQGVE